MPHRKLVQGLIQRFIPRGIRNWVRSPKRSLRYLADRIAYSFGSTPLVAVRQDWQVPCHPASRNHFEVFRSDPQQADELAAFVRHCTEGMQFLDIGAHYGFFTLAALHYAGPAVRVICIEPSSKAIRILNANLVSNRAAHRVQVFNVAMGDEDGQLAMLPTGPLGADYLIVPAKHRPDTTLIPQRSMVSVLRQTGFRPTHLKLDVEGFEFEIINGALQVLAQIHPILFLELHGTVLTDRGIDPREILSQLRNVGYQRFLIGPRETSDDEMADKGFNCRLIALP